MDHTRIVMHARSGDCPPPTRVGNGLEVTSEHGLEQLLRMHGEGASLSTIAAALNRAGFRTPRGRRWHRVTVRQVVDGGGPAASSAN